MLSIYVDANGLWWKVKFIAFGSALFNLITNIALVNFIGVYGVILSTIIAFVCIDIPLNTAALSKYYFKEKKFNIKYLSVKLINVIQLIAVVFVSSLICSHFVASNVAEFIIKMIASGIATILITLVSFVFNQNFRMGVNFVKEKRKR